MFVDEVILKVEAGKGGDGCLAFRREKYIPMGGPFGGNGGKGSDIKFVVDEGMSQNAIITKLEKDLEELEINTLLSGEYDNSDCYLEIHPGAGGTESCDWASMLLRMYERF